MAAGPRQHSDSWFQVPWESWQYFTVWRYGSLQTLPHKRQDQVSVCMSPSDRVARLYPQAPGSLFIAFYDSQGFHTGISAIERYWDFFICQQTDRVAETCSVITLITGRCLKACSLFHNLKIGWCLVIHSIGIQYTMLITVAARSKAWTVFARWTPAFFLCLCCSVCR
jgi:hypothetical protein